jgi:hypothetical protein
MAENDDEPKPTLDPDRAAILERRKRFIAMALTGLSTTACTSGPLRTTPDACLKSMPRQQNDDEDDDGPPPHPCLSVPIQPDPPQPENPRPNVCLKIAQPPAETGDDGEAAAPPPLPVPCLSKPAPKPCLKQQTPQPCLKMAQPE